MATVQQANAYKMMERIRTIATARTVGGVSMRYIAEDALSHLFISQRANGTKRNSERRRIHGRTFFVRMEAAIAMITVISMMRY